MPIEFLGIAATNDGSETTPRSGASFDKRLHPPPRPGPRGQRLGPRAVRLRLRRRPTRRRPPRTSPRTPRRCSCCSRTGRTSRYPTFAAKTFATLDQISDGRLTVHFITGGNDHEQQREGDYLTKDERYARTREYIADRQAGLDRARAVRPRRRALPLRRLRQRRLPGAAAAARRLASAARRDAAYAAGAAEADIYCLWGEPLADTAEQIAPSARRPRPPGRTTPPRIQVAFRPILGADRGRWPGRRPTEIVERDRARARPAARRRCAGATR